MLYKNREKFEKISERLGKEISRLPLTPNQWTLLGLLFAILASYFLIVDNIFFAFLFFIFVALFDMIDGAVARVTRRISLIGAYLDTIIDRLVEFAIIIGLFLSNYPPLFFDSKVWILLLLFGSFMTTYVKASASEKGLIKKEIRGGFLEHTDRLVMLLLVLLISIISKSYAMYLIAFTAILANFSALQRFLIVIKNK
jgi:phosphatidylglycerophosphate synthase